MSRTASPFVLSFLLAALVVGCDCGGGSRARSCTTSRECRGGEMCLDGVCQDGTDGGGGGGTDAMPIDVGPGRVLTSVRLDPETATLTSTDGSMPTQAFRALAVYDDGTEIVATGPLYTLGSRSTGEIDEAGGLFTANGAIGGTTSVTVQIPDGRGGMLSDEGSITVRLERTVLGTGVPDDVAARFDGATMVAEPARSAQIVYPLDGVVMPQNVYPADVQWLNGAAGDLFRVTFAKPDARVVAYVAHDGLNHWLVDEAAWRGIAQTDPDAAATLTVDRLEASGGALVTGTPVSITFARAALTGSVYYWDIGRGRIVRIDDGTATRDEFMPNPPIDASGTSRCVGCHSVSTNGRWMAGRLGGGDNIGAIFDLTTDLRGDPPPTVWPTNPSTIRWWFSSWSPDDTRMVVSFDDGGSRQMRIYDPFTGVNLPVTGTLPTNATHPSWSPDGTAIAYVSGANSWGGAFTVGDISVLAVTGVDTFGATTLVHSGAALAGSVPPGSADSYPTWSPDSTLLGFAHGDGCRSENSHAALYVMGRDGSSVTRLDRASGGATAQDSFQPRFSPFRQGGYYWLSFLSRRDYGNAQVGTRGAGRQQIWVAAIREGALDGSDPSMVAYWLPGQATTSMNISAYWAPRACRPDGESCSVGSECCGGDCRPPAGGGAPVCSPPPPERCRRSGETCSTTADCCEGMDLECLMNVCVRAPG